ncbi:hypothetical protein PV772_13715 [Pseudarthrobacter sp. CC12]|uniref:hypothetical protein n=1 Tax=Pseudarthrobacter sp. CC12 TaxID=3029193 RepID=UPI003266CD6C
MTDSGQRQDGQRVPVEEGLFILGSAVGVALYVPVFCAVMEPVPPGAFPGSPAGRSPASGASSLTWRTT